MRTSFLIAIGFISVLALGNQSPSPIPGPAVEKSRFIYQEFYPNSDKKLEIRSYKCDPKKNELQITKFESEAKVANGTVNVINIYARSGSCKTTPISSLWQETIAVPKNGKHTHVYITILSDNVTVL